MTAIDLQAGSFTLKQYNENFETGSLKVARNVGRKLVLTDKVIH